MSSGSGNYEAPYASALLDVVHAEHIANQPKPHAFDTLFRHSDGGACARYLGLKAMGYEDSDPFDPASEWVTWLGTQLHERWQESCEIKWGDEVIPELATHDPDMLASGSLDLMHLYDEKRVTVEAKFVNGTKFANAIGISKRGLHSKRKRPLGPGSGHIIQLAFNTLDTESDYGVIFYFATEALSKFVQIAIDRYYPDEPLTDKGRFVQEWVFTREQLRPIAEAELDRLMRIKGAVLLGKLPPRIAIGDNFREELVDPNDEGCYQCLYCSRRGICMELGDKIPTMSISKTEAEATL